MQFSTRNRHPAGLVAARRMLASALICGLTASCAAPGAEPARRAATKPHPATAAPAPAATSSSRSPSPSGTTIATTTGTMSPSSATPVSGHPRTTGLDPYTDDPATMAGQLNDAVATLQSGGSADEVRRNAEFQQLAIRTLVHSSRGFRRAVTNRLDPDAARITRAQIRASMALATISDPRDSLPNWRIVAPEPPQRLLRYYREAQRRTGVHWSYLAAIHLVETRMGQIRGASSAGAQGPMQFSPSTWKTYGDGGDINDNRDAILAAARLLKANGAPGDISGALWHYNPAPGYVRAVEEYARTMRTSESAYLGYWHWRVIYSYPGGTFVLPVGYPEEAAVRLPRSAR